MTDASAVNAIGGSSGNGARAARDAAGWLHLAAAPTFAIMALLTAVSGGPADILYSAARDASPLTGMVTMYALMGAFHAGPWLRLMSR
ncbi:hypothetical protein [Pseudorhodoplanes sp.]|uniref:hypothetical protein n=1 Tax=Pseudorhodoplanes sp. TaxID=1934341 RepID=UPI003D0BB954